MPPQTQAPTPPQTPVVVAPEPIEPAVAPQQQAAPSPQGTGQVLASYLTQVDQQPNTMDPTALAFAKVLADQLGTDQQVTPEMYAEFTNGLLEGLLLLTSPEHANSGSRFLPVGQALKALPSIDPIRETAFDLAGLAYGEEFGAAVRDADEELLADEQEPTWETLTDPESPINLDEADAPFDDPGPGPRPEDLPPAPAPEPPVDERKAQEGEEAPEEAQTAENPPASGVIEPQTVPPEPQTQQLPEPTETAESDEEDTEQPTELVVSHDQEEDKETQDQGQNQQ